MRRRKVHAAATPLAVVLYRTIRLRIRPGIALLSGVGAVAVLGAAAIIAASGAHAAASDRLSNDTAPDRAQIEQVYAPTFAGVPEPTSWAMVILGMGGAGVMLRRRWGAALA
jgi:hypothetical protein